jgi:hypothetical protein
MRPRRDVHVLPAADGWVVRVEGEEHDRCWHRTKPPALDMARRVARIINSTLLVYDERGKLANREVFDGVRAGGDT